MKVARRLALAVSALLLVATLITPSARAQTKDPLQTWRLENPAFAVTGKQELLQVGDRRVLAGNPAALVSQQFDEITPLPLVERFDSAAQLVASAQGGGTTVLVFHSVVGSISLGHSLYHVLVSRDGVTWSRTFTHRVFDFDVGATVALFNGSEFVVYLGVKERVRSADGRTWTIESGVNTPTALVGKTSSPKLVWWNEAWHLFGPSTKTARSSDGLTWTTLSRGLPDTATAPVELATNGRQLVVSIPGGVYLSIDAVNWTWVSIPGETTLLSERAVIRAAGGRFFRRSPTPEHLSLTSTDAVNWTPLPSVGVTSVAYRDGVFLAAMANGDLAQGDGKTWRTTFSRASHTMPTDFSYDGITLRTSAPLDEAGLVLASVDGGDFRATDLAVPFEQIRGVVRPQPGAPWILALKNGTFYRTNDGLTWVKSAEQPVGTTCNRVVAGNGRIIAGGSVLAATADGVTWSKQAVWTDDVAFYQGVFTSVGPDGVGRSLDGVTWAYTHPVTSRVYQPDLCLGLGTLNYGDTSPTGISVIFRTDGGTVWPAKATGTFNRVGGFQTSFFGSSSLLALGRADALFVSSDAIAWKEYPQARALHDPDVHEDRIVASIGGERRVARFILPRPGLSGLSTRGFVGTGDAAMIAGFVITGDRPRKTLLRASGGTTLGDYGVRGTLADPAIELVRIDGPSAGTIATNDNWSDAANAAEISTVAQRLGEFPFPSRSNDAALTLSLEPGVYTLVVCGRNGATGVALAEVYDADASPDDTSDRRIVALSTRLNVKTGDAVAISGLIVQGTRSKQMLLRGLGPELARLGVSGTLRQPRLLLHRVVDGVEVLQHTANRWADETNAPDIAIAFDECGVSALTVASDDSAMLVELQPGAYTIHLQSQDGSAGNGLIEAYEVR